MKDNTFWILFWLLVASFILVDNYIDYLQEKEMNEFKIKSAEIENSKINELYKMIEELKQTN
jgi:hypothetical protein